MAFDTLSFIIKASAIIHENPSSRHKYALHRAHNFISTFC